MARQTFNGTKINVEFEESASRQQLNSGENISTLFGKIKKIFSDLKSVCFSGSYKDLNDTPTTATADTDGLMSAEDKTKLDNADNKYALKSKYGDTTINVGRKAGTDVGDYSTAEGCNTTASGGNSHSEGLNTTASGAQSHAEGVETIASGSRSHAEGVWTIASGGSNHAEGKETTANGNNSCHAEGSKTTASGIATHAEGNSSNKVTDLITDFSWNGTTNDDIINAWNTQKFSVAHGRSSHVEGSDNLSLGHSSHSEGHNTVAIGGQSHTSGYFTKALHDNEAAYGKYNESNDNTLFSIGDGTADDARHNAFEITTTGGKLHDKNIVTDDMSLPANGGNADTVGGYSANDFAMARDSDLMTLLNGQSGDIRALVHQLSNGGYIFDTGYPQLKDIIFPITGAGNLSWSTGIFNTNGYRYGILIVRPMTYNGDTYICSVYNNEAYTDWQRISTTPIKKNSLQSVGTNIGGGGSLFSADFGTPITIACTSRDDTQCTPFLAANQWLVLAKDATTLDPIPAGSYSFDVWYI